MAQTVVPAFYSTRKRFKEPVKSLKEDEKQKVPEVFKESVKSSQKTVNTVKKTTRNKTTGRKVNKVTDYFKSKPETSKKSFKNDVQAQQSETPRTPKRNLSTPEEVTPSKKKPPVNLEELSASNVSCVKALVKTSITPKKLEPVVSRKLNLGSPIRYGSPKKFGSPLKRTELTPQKAAVYENLTNHDLASLVNESRSKILFSGRLDELKKSLEKFSNVSAKNKEFQSNAYKITSVIAPSKTSDQEPKAFIQGEPAHKKYSCLASDQSESALVLPLKYKLLAEAFRCLDVSVQILNNRKERITFEKVQNSVQKMINRNFTMTHLGQIMSVLPTAYHLEYEKIDSYTVNKASPYHLVITPNLNNVEGTNETSKGPKKNLKQPFVHINPQHLLERKKIFSLNLLQIAKKHHQDFLKKLNFPSVSDENIVRWHPKFQDDCIPDIPTATLPEVPEMKISTAREVLNKIRGTVRGRVEKALQSVADEHEDSREKSTPESEKKNSTKKPNPALKGICTDLLEKIRARESAKLVETMTRSVKDEKRLAMLEKVPKIANILWTYFIAERRSAVPVDAAIEKIRYCMDSLSSPDDIRAHLQLIIETMPGWLSLMKVSKGEYLTMDKKKDINVMLENIK